MTLQEQLDITRRLVDKLKAIRDECREKVKVPSELAQCFPSIVELLETDASSDSSDFDARHGCDPDLQFAFVDSMKFLSNRKNEKASV